ncbi:MAG: hypothetical protein M5U26_08380 [Planctomycetota bacterium]|nr:hypothetical protein [Planctomycetota bacterium]
MLDAQKLKVPALMAFPRSWLLLDPDPAPAPGGGGNPPKPNEPPKVPSVQEVAEATAKILGPVISEMVAKAQKAAQPPAPPAPPPNPNEPPKPASLDELAKVRQGFEAELAKRDQALAAERSANALRQELGKVHWFDPADAERELLPLLATKEDGSIVARTFDSIGGVKVPKDRSLAQAVADLRAAKPHWVKAQRLPGGTGATGESFQFDKDPSYEELMRPENAQMLHEFQEKHPDRAAAILTAGLDGLRNRK